MTDGPDPPEEVPHADTDIRDQLQAAGCSGPLWDYVATELWWYGWSVMSAWLSTGLITKKCWEKGRTVALPSDWTVEDREDLIAVAVADGLELFRQALVSDRWKPEQGASLRTYFLGGCVLAFPNALRRWRNDRDRYRMAAVTSVLQAEAWRGTIEPVDVVDAIDALRSLIRGESQRDQAIRQLCFDNYTPAEIADVLGMTPGAVNAALFRMRRRSQDDGEGRRR
jgi:DNA-directed RNA polymerase specialized sigma24 family protein